MKIIFKNFLGTVQSFLRNDATVVRNYQFQDRDGTIADDTDLALKANASAITNVNNTSDVNKPVSTAQQTALNLKADSTAVTSAIAAAVVGLLDLRGGYNASVNTFPASGGSGTAGAVLKGDVWIVTNAGTLGSTAVAAGDSVLAIVDTPGQQVGNWSINAYTASGVDITGKVDKETFAVLTDGSNVAWDQNNRQNPLAKITSTQSFTINMTNVKSGASGVLKLITNTASAITLSFDTDFTNKTLNTALTTYTFPAVTGKEYFLSFVVDGTTIEWVIGDVAGIPGTYTAWVPTWGGFSVNPTGVSLRYSIIGKQCHIYGEATGNGTSNAITTTMTLPVAAANTGIQEGITGLYVNSGVAGSNGSIRTRVNSDIADFYIAVSGVWGGSGNKRPFNYLNFIYETV